LTQLHLLALGEQLLQTPRRHTNPFMASRTYSLPIEAMALDLIREKSRVKWQQQPQQILWETRGSPRVETARYRE